MKSFFNIDLSKFGDILEPNTKTLVNMLIRYVVMWLIVLTPFIIMGIIGGIIYLFKIWSGF